MYSDSVICGVLVILSGAIPAYILMNFCDTTLLGLINQYFSYIVSKCLQSATSSL